MLRIHPIHGGQARYFLEGPGPGVWIGGGSEDLGLRGSVDADSLHAVLAGRQPGGDQLLSRVSPVRRSGFDLILAAPKSVSLLAALGDEGEQGRFRRAQAEAVGSALGYLEREAGWARRGRQQTPMETTGLVGAAFSHALSAAGDPHLHTHVVVANLVHGEDDRWSSLATRPLFWHARAAGALFQAGLRHHLAEQGLRFDWTVNDHGLGDIVGVPRAAIEAASLRTRQVAEEVEAGLAGRVGRATAGGRTRSARTTGPEQPWRARVAAGGLDRARVQDLLGTARTRRDIRPGERQAEPETATVERFLSERHSRFGRPDVVRAMATLSVPGAPAARLEARADDFLKTAIPAGHNQWTTAGLQRMEARIVAAAAPASQRLVGLVTDPTPSPQDAIARLTRGGAPVDMLRGDLIAQAGVLAAARDVWEASGHQVALVSPTERGQARWEALAGLGPPPPTPAHPTVVLVDNAERWSTTDLHRVVSDAVARQAKVVLLDGGTLPRRPRAESPALETLRTALPVIDAGPAPPLPLAERAIVSETAVVRAGRDGTVSLVPTGAAAMDELVRDWQQRRAAGERARMVALGIEEAEHLNSAARAVRLQRGELKGPSVEIGGRPLSPGDEVMALKRDGRLGGVPGGTVGRVTAVDPTEQRATVVWEGRDDAVTVAADRAASNRGVPLGYGYATTPAYLRAGHDGPVLGLGHVEAVAPRLRPDRIYAVVPAPAAAQGADRDWVRLDPLNTLLSEVGGRSHSGAGVAVPGDASRSLADLAMERDRLGDHLRASAPPDTGAEHRRLTEERDWLASVPDRPGHRERAAALAEVDGRLAALDARAQERPRWQEQHRDQLERWAHLSQALAWRQAALGRGAEIRPTAAVLAQLGPPPIDAGARPLWRRAAVAVESHRERWSLPDRPLELSAELSLGTPAPGELGRRAGELRILAAARDLQPGRRRDLSQAPSWP